MGPIALDSSAELVRRFRLMHAPPVYSTGHRPPQSALSPPPPDRTELDERTASLPSEQGEVIDPVYYHGKSVKEVAQIVGIPEATVKCSMRAQELAALIAQLVQPAANACMRAESPSA
jgi:DNA-directed RNA polymerase specialized sigma24 family protein